MENDSTVSYLVNLYVQVPNPAALYAHALELATTGDGAIELEDAVRTLGTADEPNVSECLRFTFDPGQSPPGTSILDSSCES